MRKNQTNERKSVRRRLQSKPDAFIAVYFSCKIYDPKQVITLYNVPIYISSKCCCYAHWTFLSSTISSCLDSMLFHIQNSNEKKNSYYIHDW